ncbi:MAG TPA: multicopper oxidase domain-containing protein [Longimicrobiales bacterium]
MGPIKLSELRSSRRSFVSGAAAALGAALAACRGEPQQHPAVAGNGGPPNGDAPGPVASRPPAPPNRAVYQPFPAELPAPVAGAVKRLHFTVRDVNFAITPDLVVPVWTFNGSLPGPVIHIRQGDSVELTLSNEGSVAHSLDTHAAQVNPATAFRSIAPGQSTTYTFTPRYAGCFIYHCGTAPVLMHIGMGMFGAMIVDPPQPLRPAREFVLVQNEFYLSTDASGRPALDLNKMLTLLPDHVTFNGHPFQYQQTPLLARRGELLRFYVGNPGPTQDCAFHIVGEQFDSVYLGSPPGNVIHGVQTYLVAAGGGMVFELLADVPGDFVFVNHKFGHGQKGAIGVLRVE